LTAEQPSRRTAAVADDRIGPAPQAVVPARRLRTFDSLLAVPALRWYLLSMLAHWSAMQMQQVVRGYLAYQLTGSFAALGAVALANSLPRLILALFGGVVADRASRRTTLQMGQAFGALLTGALAVLLFADLLRLEHLVLAALLHGVAHSFIQPARQAMIPGIVGPDRLTNAIGLNASAMNAVRLAAPALGGFLLAGFGAAWVYTLMAALYGLAVLAMFRVPIEAPMGRGMAPHRRAGRTALREIAEVFAYLRGQRTLVMLLVVHLFVVLFSMPFQRLLPGFVAEVLASNAEETAWRLGLLLACVGFGALASSLVVASLPDRRRGRLLLGSVGTFGLALLAFAASRSFWLSSGVAVILGMGQAGRQALSSILIQTHVADEFRGRVSSIMMMEMGLESLGTFGIALIATALGIQSTLAGVAGALVLVAVAVLVLVPGYRRLE